MEEILHQLTWFLCRIIYKGFIHPRWCRISSILKSTSVTKFEDGRNRLLLTSLVVHYLLYCLILSTGSAWLETGCPEYDHSESPESAWEELTWKTRAAKGSSGGSFSLRCYDYQDFNSQHAMLSLFILELAWLAESGVDLAMAGPSISEFMQIAEWIGISRLRQTVIWQNGQITAILSGLVSGLRATTETNGPLNINRNFRFHVLVFRECNLHLSTSKLRSHQESCRNLSDGRSLTGPPCRASCEDGFAVFVFFLKF